MAREPQPLFYGGSDFKSPEAAARRADRRTGAIIALLILALLAMTILPDRPSPTHETCQPTGTLTKATP